MRTVKLILSVLVIAGLSSCHKNDPWGIWGKGENVSEVRNVTMFKGIDLAMKANVYYLQDSVFYVEVTAQPNIIGHIETEVQGSVLKIDCRPTLHSHKAIYIVVHSPEMNLLHLSGSGNIEAQNTINTPSLDVTLSGSGNISVYSANANDLFGKISGSGNIQIGGGAVFNEKFRISGSGDIDSFDLMSENSEVNISGSGNVNLYAIKELNVTISGSGKVTYKGTPAIETHISGSGEIRKY